MAKVHKVDLTGGGVWMQLLPCSDTTTDTHRAFLASDNISVNKSNARRIMELLPSNDMFPVKVMKVNHTSNGTSIDVSKQAVTKKERKACRRLYKCPNGVRPDTQQTTKLQAPVARARATKLALKQTPVAMTPDARLRANQTTHRASTVKVGRHNGQQAYIPVYNVVEEDDETDIQDTRNTEHPPLNVGPCDGPHQVLDPAEQCIALADEYAQLLQDLTQYLYRSQHADTTTDTTLFHVYKVQIVMAAKQCFPHHSMGIPTSILLSQLFRIHRQPPHEGEDDHRLSTEAVIKRYAPLLRALLHGNNASSIGEVHDGCNEEEEEVVLLHCLYILETYKDSKVSKACARSSYPKSNSMVAPPASAPFDPIPCDCLEHLYHESVLSEDAILRWWYHGGFGSEQPRHRAFIHWLQHAEEEDGSEGDE